MTTQHTLSITHVHGLNHAWFVEATLANGYQQMLMRCTTEAEALVYARGVQDGFQLVKQALDIGLRFSGQIKELEDMQ